MSLFPSLKLLFLTSPFEPLSIAPSSKEPELEIEYVEAVPVEMEVVVEAPAPVARQINFHYRRGVLIEANALTLAEELKSEGYTPTHHYKRTTDLTCSLSEFTYEQEARSVG